MRRALAVQATPAGALGRRPRRVGGCLTQEYDRALTKPGHSGTWEEEGTKGQRDEGTVGRGNGKGTGTQTPGSERQRRSSPRRGRRSAARRERRGHAARGWLSQVFRAITHLQIPERPKFTLLMYAFPCGKCGAFRYGGWSAGTEVRRHPGGPGPCFGRKGRRDGGTKGRRVASGSRDGGTKGRIERPGTLHR